MFKITGALNHTGANLFQELKKKMFDIKNNGDKIFISSKIMVDNKNRTSKIVSTENKQNGQQNTSLFLELVKSAEAQEGYTLSAAEFSELLDKIDPKDRGVLTRERLFSKVDDHILRCKAKYIKGLRKKSEGIYKHSEDVKRVAPILEWQGKRPTDIPKPAPGEEYENVVSEAIIKGLEKKNKLDVKMAGIDRERKILSEKFDNKIQKLLEKKKEILGPVQKDEQKVKEELIKTQDFLKESILTDIPEKTIQQYGDVLIAHYEKYQQMSPGKISNKELKAELIKQFGEKMEQAIQMAENAIINTSRTLADAARIYPKTKASLKTAGIWDTIVSAATNLFNKLSEWLGFWTTLDDDLQALDAELSDVEITDETPAVGVEELPVAAGKKTKILTTAKIVQIEGGKWRVQSEKGKNLGTYQTKEAMSVVSAFKKPVISAMQSKLWNWKIARVLKTGDVNSWFSAFQETLQRILGSGAVDKAKEWVRRNWENIKGYGVEYTGKMKEYLSMISPEELSQDLISVMAHFKSVKNARTGCANLTHTAKDGYPNETDKCRNCVWFNTDVTMDGKSGFFGRCANCIHAYIEDEIKELDKEEKNELQDLFRDRGTATSPVHMPSYLDKKIGSKSISNKDIKQQADDIKDKELKKKVVDMEKEHKPTLDRIKKDVAEDGKLDMDDEEVYESIGNDHGVEIDKGTPEEGAKKYYDDKEGLPAMERRIKKQMSISSRDIKVARDEPSEYGEREIDTIIDFRIDALFENKNELRFGSDTEEYKIIAAMDENQWQHYIDIMAWPGVTVDYDTTTDEYVVTKDVVTDAKLKTADSDIEEEYINKAIEAIENDDQVIYDAAADKGQTVGNVKHMNWFVEVVAEWLKQQDLATKRFEERKKTAGNSLSQTLYTVKCPRCEKDFEITSGEKAISGKAECPSCEHRFEPTRYTPKSIKDRALGKDFPKSKKSEDKRQEFEKIQEMADGEKEKK